MAEIKVRGLEQSTIQRIDELAEKKGMSREAYLRSAIESLAISGELMALDFKYANLVKSVEDIAKMYGDIIDKNNYALEELLERLDNER